MANWWARVLRIFRLFPDPPTLDRARLRAHQIMRSSIVLLLAAIVVGGVSVLLFALSISPQKAVAATKWPIAALVTVISGAALLGGGLIGFLFGIPRTLQGEVADRTRRSYQVNTNLEQISDWLTKIIVGITLVELSEIPAQLQSLNVYLAPALGGGRMGAAMAGGSIVYFGVAGFFFGYLGTRLYLASAIAEGDAAAAEIDRAVDQAKTAVEEKATQDPLKPDAQKKMEATPAAANVVRATDVANPDPLQIAPDDARTIALSYYLSDRLADAVPYFERANRDILADPHFTMQHAVALAESGNHVRAVALLERLAQARLGVPNVYELLGYYLLWLSDRLQDSIRYNQEYLNFTGRDDATAIFNIAVAHAGIYGREANPDRASQHRDLAMEDLKRAIRLAPRLRERAVELRQIGEEFTSLTELEFNEAIGS